MRKAKFVAAALACLVTIGFAAAPAKAELYVTQNYPIFAKNIGNELKMRIGPGAEWGVDGHIQRGETLFVQTCQGAWCYVHRENREHGWAHKDYLVQIATPANRNDDGSYKLQPNFTTQIDSSVLGPRKILIRP